MDSTLALGAFRIARGAGGEAVDVNGNLVEREVPPGGAEGSFLCSLSSRFSGRGGGVGSLPRAWRRVGVPRRCVGAKKIVRLHRFFLHQISLESKLNGRQKVKGGNGSTTASISTSLIASLIASLITLNLGVGCAPSCWPIFGFRNLLGARRGHRGQFSVQSE